MYDLIAVAAAGVVLGGALATSASSATSQGLATQTSPAPQPAPTSTGRIRLLVRGDDIGSSHAANVATIRCYREGIMRSAELMVPCPWFPEAVAMLKENPQLDVGVHLTLTAEWDTMKWRPLTHAPSLVDKDGFFYPMTGPRGGKKEGRDFVSCGYQLDEVERELRAQIELAMKHVKSVSHLSSHMGTSTCMAELKEITQRLAREYELYVGHPESFMYFKAFEGAQDYAWRPAAMARNLEELAPGDYIFVDHPGLDVPEMQAIGHEGYRHVAQERAAVTAAFTDPRVREIVEKRKIELVSYAQAHKG